MNMIIILPLLIFGIFILAGLALAYNSNKPNLQRRLEAIRSDSTLTIDERLKLPFSDRIFLPLMDSLGNKLKKYSKEDRSEKAMQKLVQAGLYPRYSPSRMNGICLVVGLVGGALGTVYAIVNGLTSGLSGADLINLDLILYGFGGLGVGYFLPNLMVNRRIRQRQDEIRRALPSAIDLISIGAEAGMGFDQALNYVRQQTIGALADEFATTLNEIRLGKSRIDSLNNLAYRTGVDDLKTFVGAITQSFSLGTSIVETLRIQADSIRLKQRQRAQEQAMKAPVKMLFPLVFFIFPALLVVILGPAVISIYSAMLSGAF